MKDTISYSEFLFLSAVERRDPKFDHIYINNQDQQKFLGLHQIFYMEMVIALAEDGYIAFNEQNLQRLMGRLRGEIGSRIQPPSVFHEYEWESPREAFENRLIGNFSFQIRTTYRGLRRIEELRELLKRDRILEPFGVLLDMRYFQRDLEEALQRSTEVPISVLRLDLDGFKKINDNFGHAAGDIVMKSFLEAVRDSIGFQGSEYRGRGDEVAVLLIGQEHMRAAEIAEKIRANIEAIQCQFNEKPLPAITTSIGVATSPPEQRKADIETLADDRQIQAKKGGKNRVVSN